MTENEKSGRLYLEIIKVCIGTVSLLIMVFSVASVIVGYKAQDGVKRYLAGSDSVTVSDKTSDIYFDGYGTDTLFIFYGGAHVEERAYSEIAYKLAEAGIDTVIVKMPFELAILNHNAADKIRKRYPHEKYYLGGHSMGGAFASLNAVSEDNKDVYEGMIFLASYPATNLTDSGMKALSIYGTKDGVLNMVSYNKSKAYMPDDFTEYVIEGGNHADFGDYGNQRGDGDATISEFLQKESTIQCIKEFIQ